MYDLEESQDNVHLSQLMLPPQQTGGMIGSLLGSSSLELDYIWQPQEVQMVQQLKDSTYGIVTSNQGTYYIPRMIVGISAARTGRRVRISLYIVVSLFIFRTNIRVFYG